MFPAAREVQLHSFNAILLTMKTEILLFLWDLFVVLSIIPSAFFVTYQAVFNASVVWQWPVIYAGDAIYITSMIANFFKSYTDSRGKVITDQRQIIMSYFRSSFLLDLVSIIPFEIVAVVGNMNDLDFMVAVLRLNRFLRLHRVWTFLCKFNSAHFFIGNLDVL